MASLPAHRAFDEFSILQVMMQQKMHYRSLACKNSLVHNHQEKAARVPLDCQVGAAITSNFASRECAKVGQRAVLSQRSVRKELLAALHTQ